jgi:hypothetical protein
MPSSVITAIKGPVPSAKVIAERLAEQGEKYVAIATQAQSNFIKVYRFLSSHISLPNGFASVEHSLITRESKLFYNIHYGSSLGKYEVRWNVNAIDCEKPLSATNLACFIRAYSDIWEISTKHSTKLAGFTAQSISHAVGAVVAETLVKFYDDIPSGTSKMPGATTIIQCADCGADREIKVQDAFQVKRCKPCQKAYTAAQAKARRAAVKEVLYGGRFA